MILVVVEVSRVVVVAVGGAWLLVSVGSSMMVIVLGWWFGGTPTWRTIAAVVHLGTGTRSMLTVETGPASCWFMVRSALIRVCCLPCCLYLSCPLVVVGSDMWTVG